MKLKRALGKRFIPVFVCLAVLLAAVPVSANLLIMPVWIVFKDRDRTGNVTLVNSSQKDMVYTMSWRYQKQVRSGAYEILDATPDPAHDVGKMIVFSPRQVSLAPGAKQRIRLSLRRPADLPDGEYRAHLVLSASSAAPPALGKPKDGKITMGVGMNVGYSLPVIVRQGANDTKVELVNPQFTVTENAAKDPRLTITIKRSGLHGAMGKMTVFWTPPGGAEEKIGNSGNVNIFAELNERTANIPLTKSNVTGGSIRVLYEGQGPDKGVTWADQTFPIGG